MTEKNGFFKNHADTLAIIAVNLALGGLLLSICLTNISSVAAANARIDMTISMMQANDAIMNAKFDSLMKEMMAENKDFHSRLFAIEERNKK